MRQKQTVWCSSPFKLERILSTPIENRAELFCCVFMESEVAGVKAFGNSSGATFVLTLILPAWPLAAQGQPPPAPPPAGSTPAQTLPGNTGIVTGTVKDDSGKPVPYARVFLNQALPVSAPASLRGGNPVITGPQMASAIADVNGKFTGFLPPGSYVACAQTTTPGLLDPCHWAANAPAFAVTKGQYSTGVNITMAKGAVIPIHIDDPHKLLDATASGPIAADCRFQIVTAKGFRHEAIVTARNGNGRDHVITVPFGTPLKLQVISPHLVVNDETGAAALASGKDVNIPAPLGASPMKFTVGGAK